MTANVADLLSRAAAADPEGVALVQASTGQATTWGELDEAVTRFAAGLGERGLVAGNRVVIATANRAEFVTAYFGVLRARLVAVPVNPRSATGELVRTVADSGARLLVADATTLTDARAVVTAVGDALVGASEEVRARTVVPRLVVVDAPAQPGETSWEELLATPPRDVPEARDPEALAVLLYTSGTSARPRAAMLTHRALVANVEQTARIDPPPLQAGDVVYGVLPLFHVYGLNAVLTPAVRHRATVVVADSFDPEGSLLEIERYGVTVLPVAPPVLAHWRNLPDPAAVAGPLSGVRLIMSGSAPLAPEVVEEFTARTGKPVHQGYGLTEAAPVVTSTLCSATLKPGSVGAPVPGVSVRLVDDTGQEPAPGDPGEIWVSGDNLFEGYWPDCADGPVDGWFATGDVGIVDGDGDLFLVDRLKEIVIVSGFNVYPTEVEEVVCEVDGVLEAAVLGVPDELTGEAVVAYIRTDLRDPAEIADLERRVREACAARLARFKHPSRVLVVEELPHTVTGKVAKGRLRSAARRQRLGLVE